MSKIKDLAVAFVLFLGMFALGLSGAKERSDKERISVLEQQVEKLNEAVSDQALDLEGAHKWAGSVNDRLLRLENRGPVAKR